MRLTPASAVKMRPVRWIWTERIPAGAITVVPGREGIGKSLLLAWLTGRITTGGLPGLHLGHPRPVIYAATEDSWAYTIAPRLHAAGANLDMVYRVDVERDGVLDQLTLPRDCASLAVEIDRLGVAMLAADPLLSLIQAGIDTHRDRDLRRALEPLAALADSTSCAVVGLAHFNKSSSDDPLNLITGSRAFPAVARAVIAIAKDPDANDKSCVMSQAKSNLGRMDVPSLRYIIESYEIETEEGPTYTGKLVFTGETDRSVNDILGESTQGTGQRQELGRAEAWLVDFLTSRGGQAPRGDVVEAALTAGIAESTLKRARSKAGVEPDRSGYQGGGTWRLTTSNAQSPETLVNSHSAHSDQLSERELNEPNGVRMASTKILGHSVSLNGAVIK